MAFSKLRPRLSLIALCVIAGLCLTFLTTSSNGESQKADSSEKADEAPDKLTIPEARRHTKLLHDTYIATLHTVHRSYFDKDERAIIPARAMEEVFRQIDAETGGKTRWIAVNTPAMNIDHNPKEGFEKDAARELKKGKRDFESRRRRHLPSCSVAVCLVHEMPLIRLEASTKSSKLGRTDYQHAG